MQRLNATKKDKEDKDIENPVSHINGLWVLQCMYKDERNRINGNLAVVQAAD